MTHAHRSQVPFSVFDLRNEVKCVLDTSSLRIPSRHLQTNDFQGDLTEISGETKVLVPFCTSFQLLPHALGHWQLGVLLGYHICYQATYLPSILFRLAHSFPQCHCIHMNSGNPKSVYLVKRCKIQHCLLHRYRIHMGNGNSKCIYLVKHYVHAHICLQQCRIHVDTGNSKGIYC